MLDEMETGIFLRIVHLKTDDSLNDRFVPSICLAFSKPQSISPQMGEQYATRRLTIPYPEVPILSHIPLNVEPEPDSNDNIVELGISYIFATRNGEEPEKVPIKPKKLNNSIDLRRYPKLPVVPSC